MRSVRDERDTQRAVAPLKPAADAIQLDSTELSIEQVLQRIRARSPFAISPGDQKAGRGTSHSPARFFN
jgi:hypothetical protein